MLHNSPRPANTSPTGRGLALVRALASRVGVVDDAGGGKVVWSEWEHPALDGEGDAVLEADREPVAIP